MVKPTWITTQPSGGTGDGTVKIIGAKHTGRLQRSGALTYKANGVSDKTQSVTQAARSEFVSASDISASKIGGNVTLTGKSNSAKLNFQLGVGDIPLSLPVSYVAAGAATNNNVPITGDPGASAEFDFSMVIAVPANTTASVRSRQITVTATGNQVAAITLTQASGDPSLSVSPVSVMMDSEGTAVNVIVTSNTTWTVE